MNKELIIPNPLKNNLVSNLIVFISIVAACVALISIVSSLNTLGIIKYLIQGLLGFIICLFSIGIFYILFSWNDIAPIAHFTQDGVGLKYHNFVAWKDIKKVSLYTVYSTPVECIAIEVKNYDMLFQQSTLSGKCALFWAKVFGYPHIILCSMENIRNSEIIEFAHKYL